LNFDHTSMDSASSGATGAASSQKPDGSKKKRNINSFNFSSLTGTAASGHAKMKTVSIPSALIGIFLGLVSIGCFLGTWIQFAHLDHVMTNLVIGSISGLISVKLLIPAWLACLKTPGYVLPVELQDML